MITFRVLTYLTIIYQQKKKNGYIINIIKMGLFNTVRELLTTTAPHGL